MPPGSTGRIAINILHHYIDTLKETLIADADTLTDENADYCVAIGTTTLLPERFAEYVKSSTLFSIPLSAAPGLTRGQYVEFYDASASTAVSWRIYVYRPGYLFCYRNDDRRDTASGSAPAARDGGQSMAAGPLTGEGTRVIQLAMFSLLSKSICGSRRPGRFWPTDAMQTVK